MNSRENEPSGIDTRTYPEKLKDPRWQKKRLQIFERDKWTCQSCGSTSQTLQVHHRRYLPKKQPWQYDDRDLVTLCSQCHQVEREQWAEFLSELEEILHYCGLLGFDLHGLAASLKCLADNHTHREILDRLWKLSMNDVFHHQRKIACKFIKIELEAPKNYAKKNFGRGGALVLKETK